MRTIKIIRLVVFAAAILSLACSKSDTGLTGVGNSSSPASTQNNAVLANESPLSFAGESQEGFLEERPVYEY